MIPTGRVLLPAFLLLSPDRAVSQISERAEFFEIYIRPLLAQHCFSCHTGVENGGLRLDSREAILNGGYSGASVVPGKPEDSLLIKAVSHTHEYLRMPLGGSLQKQEIEWLKTWIRDGAFWPESPAAYQQQLVSRSFQPLKDARQAPELQPGQVESKRRAIQRASSELSGLPPTSEEIDAFLKDESPHAFEKVVDRLLASPRYGEKWGQQWTVLMRSAGSAKGTEYLDYAVRSFNSDKPYDQFIHEHVAGDWLLDIHRTPKGAIENLGKTFLGLNLACARCHDHNYAPVSQADYQGIEGAFTGTLREPRRMLTALGGPEISSREQLSRWIASRDNPLTARVMVSRICQRHFPDATLGTHPDLWDYLALRFIESGWSVKSIHKLIILSRMYLSCDE